MRINNKYVSKVRGYDMRVNNKYLSKVRGSGR